MYLLRVGTKEQLIRSLKVDEETARQIVNEPSRKSKRTVEEFRDLLPEKNYLALKSRFDQWVTHISIKQNNVHGDIVAGDKHVTNIYTPSDSLIDLKNQERESFLLPQLKGTSYCTTTSGFRDSAGNTEIEITLESIGEKGRIKYISDTINTIRYDYTMYLNPDLHNALSIGKRSSIFYPGDIARFDIKCKEAVLVLDLHFLNAEGTEYYQRARPHEGLSCYTYQLSLPVKVKAITR